MAHALRERLRILVRCCRRRGRILLIAVAAAVLLFAAILLWPMDISPYLRVSASGEMQDRSGRLLYAFLNSEEQWCFARDLSAISPRLIQAIIAAEDQRFNRHWGVDPIALLRAFMQNLRHRCVVSGASTLTMQVVKRADRTPRSLFGKIGQMLQAIRLERHASKGQILHAYLNRAPYGLNLIGCEAASRRFFGKPASELTLAEAALIAGLPKAPTAYAPVNHPDDALKRRNHVLRRMLDERFITTPEFDRARSEPLRAAWHSFPVLAPHLAMLHRPAIVERGRIRTTLEQDAQIAAEHLVKASVERLRGEIGNAAAIIIDVPAASVLARVASADFSDTSQSGQVDACRSARSPGSALKPFAYAVAMERGCLYAGETLLDSSLDYGPYAPENYDRMYQGLVSASYALRRSLNIPAITVLERVGAANVHAFLRRAGLTTLDSPPERYGLGLTLGDCEVRLDELAAAYCLLANLGEYRPLRILADSPTEPPQRCLSRGTCLKLYDMLEQPLPAELNAGDARPVNVPTRVCWKTGTSTGHHDAWAFVFNSQYLVGVWMGNADGRPSNRLVGAETALPLAARLFRTLPPTNTPAWPEVRGDLCEASVCAVSGLPAGQCCAHTRLETFPRNQFLNRVCDMHYPARSGSGIAGRDGGVVERWPATARGWNLARIPAAVAATGARTNDARVRSARSFRILCPADKAEYVISGEPNADRIRLRASLNDQAPLHWYADGIFLGTSASDSPLLWDLSPGAHRVTCMTLEGSVDQVSCTVALPDAAPHFRQSGSR